MIDIDTLTIGEARKLASLLAGLIGLTLPPAMEPSAAWDHDALPLGVLVADADAGGPWLI